VSRWRAASVVALACACGAKDDSAGGEDFADPYMDEPLPPECRDTSTGACGDTDEASECVTSESCPVDQVCAADFNGDIGRFRCQASCIASDDASRWCVDSAACCDAAASCVRGLCLLPDETSSGP
jgi:hypothetical protein